MDASADVKLAVHRILRAGRGDFHPQDFKSSEEYEEAIGYLDSLQSAGVEILDRIRESQSGERKLAVVAVRLTDAGKIWLQNQP
jgi:hypothetical protein